MKNAAIYARFSSHAQNEQSIEGQLKDCYAFAERNGYRIIHEYIDRALTGTTDKRPEFLKMIEESKRKQFQFVICYQLDRFARNRYDSATYKSRLKKNGVRVLSAKENITDDASGILIEGVLESMAEYYSVELSQKVRRGIDIAASKCRFFGGQVPLGYKVDSEKKYILDEVNAPIVHKMFEMLASGSNYAQIGRYLNERGIPTSTGGKWGKNSYTAIFGNRKYLGKYIYRGNEIDGGIPRIIEDDLFEQVQQILRRNAQAPSRGKAKVDYMLSGKLICGSCGDNWTGVSAKRAKKTHNYYRCHTNAVTGKCPRKVMRKQFVEDELIRGVQESLTDEWIDAISAETYLMIQAERNDTEIKRMEKLIADNQTSINNLMKVLMLGKVTNVILAQIEQLENDNKELKATIESEKAMQIDYSYTDIKKWLSHFKNLDYSKPKNRKDLIETFVYKVILYEDKMKLLLHLKGGQKGELLLNLIFPDYPDGNGNGGGNTGGCSDGSSGSSSNNKNEGNASSCACLYTPVVVGLTVWESNLIIKRDYFGIVIQRKPKAA